MAALKWLDRNSCESILPPIASLCAGVLTEFGISDLAMTHVSVWPGFNAWCNF